MACHKYLYGNVECGVMKGTETNFIFREKEIHDFSPRKSLQGFACYASLAGMPVSVTLVSVALRPPLLPFNTCCLAQFTHIFRCICLLL